jgi:hypothetical protein
MRRDESYPGIQLTTARKAGDSLTVTYTLGKRQQINSAIAAPVPLPGQFASQISKASGGPVFRRQGCQ